MTAKILYITYDGLTDPLGQSQIIPYLNGLSQKGYYITIISCEKANTFKYPDAKNSIDKKLKNKGINWHPLSYTKSPPVLSTLWDIFKLRQKAFLLNEKESFAIVHCRSYIASLIGLWMKKKYGTKFIFDMRGFWADERLEGALWNFKNPIFKLIYKYFKKKERTFLTQADYTISLTEKAKKIIHSWEKIPGQAIPIEVIPCCVDTEHFKREKVEEQKITKLKKQLNFKENDFILAYLGSTGTWYLPNEMLDFFKCLLQAKPNSKLLFITQESEEVLLCHAKKINIPIEKIIVQKALYSDVPSFLALSTLAFFFIKPCFSKSASSPTKLAEFLSMGIPVICNCSIGDTDEIVRNNKCGIVIEDFTTQGYSQAIARISECLKIPPENIRNIARKYFSLENGVNLYASVYAKLIFNNSKS